MTAAAHLISGRAVPPSAPIHTSLFRSPDLFGDCLVVPFRSMHDGLMNRVESVPEWATAATAIGAATAAIFLYPILGAVALVGMVIKLTGVPFVNAYNEHALNRIKDLKESMNLGSHFATYCHGSSLSRGSRLVSYKTFQITKTNVDAVSAEVEREVRGSYRYLTSLVSGAISYGYGQITVELQAYEPVV